ncbi:unnamed protein product [Rotaria socialis]|uniref:Uncharacterized protein n=2 Tax=Rotaria socialis TaxID=392032 RepID=A0A818NEX6_9BILA|nr:unnamed protein product [Rotaria socialis]
MAASLGILSLPKSHLLYVLHLVILPNNLQHFFMFGRHSRHSLSLCLPPPRSLDQHPAENDLSDYRKRLLVNLLPAYVTAREILDISHEKQARQYNRHHRPVQFEPGDLVWVTGLSGIAKVKWRGKKLSPRRDGPYRITQRLSQLTYSLIHTITGQQLSPIDVDRLHPQDYSFTIVD